MRVEAEKTNQFKKDLSSNFRTKGRMRFGMNMLLALAITTGTACATNPAQPVIAKTPVSVEQKSTTIDLGLKIDEKAFLGLAKQGPKWGTLPETDDKDKLACPSWSPGICMGKYSPNFTVAINGPMADFMFKQSQASSPLLPVKIIFVEEWGEINNKDHVSGFTGITADGKEIDIVMSLKAISWEVFQSLSKNNLSMDYFEGTLSYLLSRYTVHELGHAGAEAKKLAKPGKPVPEIGAEDVTHPQVYAFDARYDQLFHQAETIRMTEGARSRIGK